MTRWLVALLATVGLAALARWQLGHSLGVYFAGLLLALLLSPMVRRDTMRGWVQLAMVGAVAAGLALSWAWDVASGNLPMVDWFLLAAVAACFALACGCAAGAMARVAGDVASRAVVIVLGVAWLSWPAWASPYVSGRAHVAQELVDFSPTFAVNAVVPELGIWTENSIIYRVGTLNQDVLIALPGSIVPAALLHGALGLAGAAIMLATRRGAADR